MSEGPRKFHSLMITVEQDDQESQDYRCKSHFSFLIMKLHALAIAKHFFSIHWKGLDVAGGHQFALQ